MAQLTRLTVRFLGLAALVPPREEGDRWLSVLPDLRDGARAGSSGIPYEIAPHQALVAVRRSELVDSEKPPKLRATLAAPSLGGLLPEDEEFVFLEPRGEAISLASGEIGLELENQVPAGYGSRAAKAGEEESLCWVPPLARVSNYSRFDRSLLGPDEQERTVVPVDPRLAGTFVLDRGRLSATGVIQGALGAALYEFRDAAPNAGAGAWKQSLATGYELELQQAGGSVVLVFEDAGGTRRRVELRGPDARIWVINRELEEILGFTSFHQATGPALSGDQDFAYFYSLAEGWNPQNPGAIPIPFVATPGPGGQNKPCGAPQFSS